MGKLTRNEVKHIDKLQEALEELKKPKFKNVGEYGKYIKTLKSPTYDQKALIVFSIIDMIEADKREWGEMNNDKLIAIVSAIADEVGLPTKELLKILMHLLDDLTYFIKISKEFKDLFVATKQ